MGKKKHSDSRENHYVETQSFCQALTMWSPMMKRTGNLLFYFFSPIQTEAFYFPSLLLNPLCFAVKLSIGETMVTNNLFCFNEKYVSWWETKPGINTEGTLNNGPWAGVCPKLCCSFFSPLPSIPVPVWLCKIILNFLKKNNKNKTLV